MSMTIVKITEVTAAIHPFLYAYFTATIQLAMTHRIKILIGQLLYNKISPVNNICV